MDRKRQHLCLLPSAFDFKSNEWQLFPRRLRDLLLLSPSSPAHLLHHHLTRQEVEEKNRLLKLSFPTWTRRDFFLFLYYSNRGRRTAAQVAELMPNKPAEEVEQYASALLERGEECLGAENWRKASVFLFAGGGGEAGEADGEFGARWRLRCKLVQLEHQVRYGPVAAAKRQHLLGGSGGVGTMTVLEEEECVYLSAVLLQQAGRACTAQHVKLALTTNPAFALDHYVRALTVKDIEERIEEARAREMAGDDRQQQQQHKDDDDEREEEEEEEPEDEDDDDERAAAAGEEDARLWEREHNLREELEWLDRTLHPRAGLFSPLLLASSSSSAAAAGVGLRMGSPPPKDDDADSDGGGGNHVISLDPRFHAQVLSVVLSLGTAGMSLLVNQVIKVLPEGSISKRQLKRDILCLAVKEKRAGDRAARWYARTSDLAPPPQ